MKYVNTYKDSPRNMKHKIRFVFTEAVSERIKPFMLFLLLKAQGLQLPSKFLWWSDLNSWVKEIKFISITWQVNESFDHHKAIPLRPQELQKGIQI